MSLPKITGALLVAATLLFIGGAVATAIKGGQVKKQRVSRRKH